MTVEAELPFVAEKLLRQPPEVPHEPAPLPSSFSGSNPGPGVADSIRRGAWSRRAAGWAVAATGVTWAFAIAVWSINLTSGNTRPLAFDGKANLHDATRTWIQDTITPSYDQLNLFLTTTLTPLYQFTPDGANLRAFVKGAVAPQILENAELAFARDRKLIQKRGIRQDFQMFQVRPDEIELDAVSHRVAVTVHGLFLLTFREEPKTAPVAVPYTARVVLSPNTPSSADQFPFYLADLMKP